MHDKIKPNTDDLPSKKNAIQLSIATAGFLTLVKVGFGLATHSMSILASATDSLMDVLVSTVNYISLKEAHKPADDDHTYGHGKIESLAGLFQSVFISASGFYLIYESVTRLFHPTPITHIQTAIWVMAISIVATFFLLRRLRAVASETRSMIVGTESLHFATDLATNLGVILALVLVYATGFVFWDLVIAIVIAVYILKQSFQIFRIAIDELVDRALPEEVQEEIRQTITNFDKRILGFHNLRTRKMGERKFIDFHVELDRSLSFQKAHDLTEDLIEALEAKFPESDVNVHFDPEGGR